MQVVELVPLAALAGLVVVLLGFPRAGMAKPAVIAALIALAAVPSEVTDVLRKVGPSLVGVLVIMSAVQLSVSMLMDERGGDWLGRFVTRPLHSSWLAMAPASVLVPVIVLPLAMASAAVIHNIPAVAMLAPITISLCRRLQIAWVPSLVGLIPASNLGGASAAWGDTPAILQRQVWGFDIATFSANMLPRNLLILALLVVTVAVWSYFANPAGQLRAREMFERIRIRDQERARTRRAKLSKEQLVGAACLLGLFLAQMFEPVYALALSMAILAVLLACRNTSEFVRSTFVLGDEAVLAISALFTLSAVIEHSPLTAAIVHRSLEPGGFGVELVAFLVTSMISADGAAAMLASLVHAKHEGAMDAAWSLASGICAGSTALLTSASAGPVLIEATKRSGELLTFRTYAAFGVPFSVVMLIGYLVLGG